MQEIYRRVQQIARYPNSSVLISGESGTGKELIAGAIHPLRDRKEDIPLLVDAFLKEISQENDVPTLTMSPRRLKVLMDYDWPGNVRELRKMLI